MSRFSAMASTLSGTRKNEPSRPTSVAGRSLCLKKSSRSPLLAQKKGHALRHAPMNKLTVESPYLEEFPLPEFPLF